MPGGYGSQTRDYLNYFRKQISVRNYVHERDWKEVYQTILVTKIADRRLTGNKSNSILHLPKVDETIVERSNGDLFHFLYFMIYFDNETLYNTTNKAILSITADVVFEEIKKQFPNYTNTDIGKFKLHHC